MSAHTHEHGFLPGAGHRLLTPLYDTLSRLGGTAILHARVVDLARIEPGHRVLDLGCGTGAVAVRVADQPLGAEVVGVDPDADMLDRARRKAADRGLSASFTRGFAEDLPFEDDSFDRVVSSLALHHIDASKVPRAASEIRRVLRPEGIVVIADIEPEESHGHGLLSRVLAKTGAAPDVHGVDVVDVLTQSGFNEVAAVGHERLRFLGTVSLTRAVA